MFHCVQEDARVVIPISCLRIFSRSKKKINEVMLFVECFKSIVCWLDYVGRQKEKPVDEILIWKI